MKALDYANAELLEELLIEVRMIENKVSICIFNGSEVRALWDSDHSVWWFSVVDVIAAITNSKNPANYWKVLKHRLKTEKFQLVTICNQLKLLASDGKRYKTDCLTQNDMLALAEVVPSKNSMQFAKWLITGEEELDSKSRNKAYELWDSNLLLAIEIGTTKGLQQIHSYLFGGLYDFAGQIRTKNIAKGGFQFAMAQHLPATLRQIDGMPETSLVEIIEKYVEMNVAHPFMEGNGRSTRLWLDMLLKARLQKCVDWSQIDKNEYLKAMSESVANSDHIKSLIEGALTDRINDREMFMKGIDYSYYYEEIEE